MCEKRPSTICYRSKPKFTNYTIGIRVYIDEASDQTVHVHTGLGLRCPKMLEDKIMLLWNADHLSHRNTALFSFPLN